MSDSPSPASRRYRKPLGRLLLEMLAISASILLALAADEWLTQRRNREKAREAMANFRQELELNRAQIEAGLPRLESVHKSARQLVDAIASGQPPPANTMEELRVLVAPEGLQVVALHSTAWQTAVATGTLSHLDYATVYELSHIYSWTQPKVTQIQDKVIDLGFRAADNDPRQLMEILFTGKMLVQELLALQQGLLRKYDRILAKIPAGDERA